MQAEGTACAKVLGQLPPGVLGEQPEPLWLEQSEQQGREGAGEGREGTGQVLQGLGDRGRGEPWRAVGRGSTKFI